MPNTNNDVSAEQPFRLVQNHKKQVVGKIKQAGLLSLEALLGLTRCQNLYDELSPTTSIENFTHQALDKLQVKYQVDSHHLNRIPHSGGGIVVANHPYGGIDGLILIHLISQVRQDFKVMGNFVLNRIPQLREHLINVDPFSGGQAARANIGPLRQAIKVLKEGQLLLVFPAGEVSSWKPMRGVTDPQWSTTIARLVRMGRVPVLPIYFPGSNGPIFQAAGIVHPRLRTALLPKMLLNKQNRTIRPVIGNQIPSKQLIKRNNDRDITELLRLKTYALKLDTRKRARQVRADDNHADPIAAPVNQKDLRREIAALSDSHTLVENNDAVAYAAKSHDIPVTLREIGRLRELTFRDVGEGTGQAADLDRYDQTYLHLFLWDKKEQRIMGAYRIGQVDRILKTQGPIGLYSSTLFHFKPQLFEQLGHALELGRSFVHPDYQRSFSPLLMLWKGISAYLVQNPQYRYLFGPVSISADYSQISRQLLTGSLASHYRVKELERMVTAKLPVKVSMPKIDGFKKTQVAPYLKNLDDLSMLVTDLEQDNKGIPVLLRHYLNLGGKLLAFNLDPAFSHVIDGLLLIDLLDADHKQMKRYMGREGYQGYIDFHRKLCCA